LEDDIPKIVLYHYVYYSQHYGFNHDFGRYVKGPLTEFFHRNSEDEKIWLLDEDGELKGCIALARVTSEEAQLRWFYVDESLRGNGYGQKLVSLLIQFAREKNYGSIILWTVSLLEDARRLYEKNGFVLEELHLSNIWGMELMEQKYRVTL
jgi:GNAT superfamily N-acetyltransferase